MYLNIYNYYNTIKHINQDELFKYIVFYYLYNISIRLKNYGLLAVYYIINKMIIIMEVFMIIDNKSNMGIIEIWLTAEENKNDKIKTEAKEVAQKFKNKKIQVAIFISGEKDLCSTMENLIIKNKKYS